MTTSATVLGLLKDRMAAGSLPGRRHDNHKLWLAIEGGGQAGAITGGFVSGLERMGCLPCFDGIIGSSSGAMTGAYFGAGAAAMGTTIFPEDNCDGRFLSLWRLLGSKPVMNLDYLVDDVMMGVKQLPVERLTRQSIPVLAMATRRDGVARLLKLSGVGREDVRDALKVTARVPVWAERKLKMKHLWDGVFASHAPVDHAYAQGATHVLWLSSKCAEKPTFGNGLEGWVQGHFLKRHAPSLLAAREAAAAVLKRQIGEEAPHVFRMALPYPRLGAASTNRRLVWDEIVRAYAHMTGWLGAPGVRLPALWTQAAL